MAERPHMPHPATSSALALAPSWSYRLAKLVGYVISPLVLPPILFGFVLHHAGASPAETVRVALLVAVLLGGVPLAYVYGMVRRGAASSIELYDRKHRTRPFLCFIGSATAAALAVGIAGETAVALLLALLGCSILNVVLVLLINLRWKISVHTASLAGFAVILLVVGARLPGEPTEVHGAAWTAGLLVPLVAWARVRIGAHTPAQVLGGVGLGLAVPAVELAALFAFVL